MADGKPVAVFGWVVTCPTCKVSLQLNDPADVKKVSGHLVSDDRKVIATVCDCPVCNRPIVLLVENEHILGMVKEAANVIEQLFPAGRRLHTSCFSSDLATRYAQLSERIDQERAELAKAKQDLGVALDDYGGAVVLETTQPKLRRKVVVEDALPFKSE